MSDAATTLVKCPVCGRKVDTFKRPGESNVLLFGHKTVTGGTEWCGGSGATA